MILLSCIKDLFWNISYAFKREMFNVFNRQSRVMSYEFYLMDRHPIDKVRMSKCLDEVRLHGKATFYSEVFKEEITLSTNL